MAARSFSPFVGRPIVPSEYGERFASGHIIEQGRHLFVSTGLRYKSPLPVRFRVPPEISSSSVFMEPLKRVTNHEDRVLD